MALPVQYLTAVMHLSIIRCRHYEISVGSENSALCNMHNEEYLHYYVSTAVPSGLMGQTDIWTAAIHNTSPQREGYTISLSLVLHASR